MKELSIEEKAQRYDETLKQIKECTPDENGFITIYPQEIFPELKESEDEEIRKSIIAILNNYVDNSNTFKPKMLAWLEKQGEQNYKIIKGKNYFCVKTHNYAGVEWIKGTKYYASDNYTLVNQGCEYYCPEYSKEEHNNLFEEVKYDGCVEKQCEQKPAEIDNKFLRMRETKPKDISEFLDRLTTVEQEFLWEHIAKIRELDKEGQKPQGKSALEAAKEEKVDNQNCVKSANKPEPKFHEGDWVVSNLDGKVRQISEVHSDEYNSYYVVDGKSVNLEEYDRLHHLWTIRDAKGGDVLVYGKDKRPFIFKGLLDKFYPNRTIAYCGIDESDTFEINTGCGWWTDEEVYPATEEQCYVLFQNIKEAGYEWDSNKKELKKIENEHICELDNLYTCVKFPFKAKVKSSGAIVTIHGGQLSDDGKEWIKYQSDAEDGYKVYELNNLELVCEIKQKPAWSEEDEKIALSIEQVMNCASLLNMVPEKENKIRTWLKSIKDRVQPQKQEWSDVDKDILFRIINDLKFLRDDISKDTKYAVNIVDVEREINWLKSLKPQSQWKPSDEQMNAFDAVLVYNELKKLKEE